MWTMSFKVWRVGDKTTLQKKRANKELMFIENKKINIFFFLIDEAWETCKEYWKEEKGKLIILTIKNWKILLLLLKKVKNKNINQRFILYFEIIVNTILASFIWI